MPDFGREDRERKLARALAKANAETRAEVLALLGDPPDIDALTPEVWAQIEARYSAILMPQLETAFVAAMEAQALDAGVAFAWDMANERAIQWAQQYTFELIGGINRTSEQRLKDAIRHFYENRIDMDGVLMRINNLFGPQRAEMIAITEITRAASGGAQWYDEELRALGVQTEQVWETADDDVVCAICGPLDGKVIESGMVPPAHPRCRCWVSVRPVLPEG